MNVQFLHLIQDTPFEVPHTEDLKITILNYDPAKAILAIDTRAPWRNPAVGDMPYQNDVYLANHLASVMMRTGCLPDVGKTIYVRVSLVESTETAPAANDTVEEKED